MRSAVLFLTYRRFHTAERVFEAIRVEKPPRLYFASNSANPDNEGEQERVNQVRSLIDRIDWDCEINTRFLDTHLSVRDSIPSSIDWFLRNEDEGIILEDDCLPDQTFFLYCDELLERYRENERIMMISGNNFMNGRYIGDGDYYYSKHCHIWGWATWRRAWAKYDMAMMDWPERKKKRWLLTVWPNLAVSHYWTDIFDGVYSGKVKTWDYQWNYSCWKHNGLSCTPNINLVKNIGFGEDSTFTSDSSSKFSDMQTGRIDLPITSPSSFALNAIADYYENVNVYGCSARGVIRRMLSTLINPIKK